MKKSMSQLIIIIFFCPIFLFADSKAIFFKQIEKWELPANNNHPRLYFDKKGAEKLFHQYKSGSTRLLTFLSKCDSIIIRPLPDYSNFDKSRYIARDESEQLSFAYVITRKVEYANYAKKIIKQMIQWKDWVYDEHKPRRVDLGVAGVGYILALCYDWLYPALSPTEREEIKRIILRQALEPFVEIYTNKSEEWTQVNHNWRSVICGEMGIIALAVYKDTCIAGALYLHLGEKAVYKFGASNSKYQNLRPNDLVMAEAIKWYSTRGFKSLSLGRTSLENSGLRQFKNGWGAAESTISYCKYDILKDELVIEKAKTEGFHTKIFSKMPLPLLRLTGSLLYRHAA